MTLQFFPSSLFLFTILGGCITKACLNALGSWDEVELIKPLAEQAETATQEMGCCDLCGSPTTLRKLVKPSKSL